MSEDDGILEIDVPGDAEPPVANQVGGGAPKRRDPFAGEVVSADDVLHSRKELTTRGDLKRIQKAGVRHGGQKVVTDDVKKLKSLAVDPGIPEGDRANYCVEPVLIEYYVPKDSRFVHETRHLYIPLIDPEPDDRYPILNEAMKKGRFFDVIEVIADHSQYTTTIIESYHEVFTMHESISRGVKDGRFNAEHYRRAFYLVETLMKLEPTYASLHVLGDYVSYNINWLIRRMNELGLEFSASDDTIAYLIKRRNIRWEEKDYPQDERFEILAALFYDQAFPNRGLAFDRDDYFFDIFDRGSRRNR